VRRHDDDRVGDILAVHFRVVDHHLFPGDDRALRDGVFRLGDAGRVIPAEFHGSFRFLDGECLRGGIDGRDLAFESQGLLGGGGCLSGIGRGGRGHDGETGEQRDGQQDQKHLSHGFTSTEFRRG
jgi:hypothetical protein